MTKKQYSELLLKPEWKSKRLEILERDGYKCTECGSTTNLHAHHLYYEGNNNPWDYPNEALITLCKGCHAEVHDIKNKIKDNFWIVFEESLELLNLLGFTEYRLLLRLLPDMVYNTNIVFMSKKYKDLVCEELEIKAQAFSNALNKLKRKNVLFYDRGEWTVNPLYFWKGDLPTRIKVIVAKCK